MLALKTTAGDRRDEQGSTLVTVLVVMLVLTLAGLTLAAITVNTADLVVSSRSTAQSRAAADAGLSQAIIVAIRDGEVCDAGPVEVSPVQGDLGGGSAYTVTRDCTSLAGRVVFQSVGYGPHGARTTTEAVYAYEPLPMVIKEPALITRAPLNLSALKITAMDPAEPATVWVIPEAGASGDFTCNSGGAIAGSVYLPAGAVFGEGGCEVTGDVYAEKDVVIDRGTSVHGDLVSLSGKIRVAGGSDIDGGVYASGDIVLDGGPTILGDVVSSAGSVSTTGGMTIGGSIHARTTVKSSSGSPRFAQSIFAGGNLELSGGKPAVRDRIIYGSAFSYSDGVERDWATTAVERSVLQPAVSAPRLPTAPEWQGITQDDLDALVSNGVFQKLDWTGSCAYGWWPEHEMIAKIKGLTTPTIIDARGCAQLDLHQYSGTTTLKTDVVFVAPSFNIEDQEFKSADGNRHRLWFISPESPTRKCNTVPPISIDGSSMIPKASSKISAMIFTQCTVDFPNSGEGWQGSIQAGAMTGKPNYLYEPVGFPGSKTEEDEDVTPVPAPTLGELLSRRDVAP